MSRKYTSRSIGVDHGTIHIDDFGICASWTWGIVRKYDHNYKLVEECRDWGNNRASLVYSGSSHNWIFTGWDSVFLVEAGKWKCVFRNGRSEIASFMYHPGRDTYLMAYAGYVMELGLDLQLTSRARQTYSPRPMMIPSSSSPNLYMINRSSNWTEFDIICNDIKEHIFDLRGVPHTFIPRPEHTDILTIVYEHRIDIIDLWHTSSTPITSTHIKIGSHHAAYVNPNVCAISEWNQLQMIDLRCGLIRSFVTDTNLRQMWYAQSRIYITGSYLLMLD